MCELALNSFIPFLAALIVRAVSYRKPNISRFCVRDCHHFELNTRSLFGGARNEQFWSVGYTKKGGSQISHGLAGEGRGQSRNFSFTIWPKEFGNTSHYIAPSKAAR
jgi:hypothetical protein